MRLVKLLTLFATSLINSYYRSMYVRFYLSYDPKITFFEIMFHGMKNLKILRSKFLLPSFHNFTTTSGVSILIYW